MQPHDKREVSLGSLAQSRFVATCQLLRQTAAKHDQLHPKHRSPLGQFFRGFCFAKPVISYATASIFHLNHHPGSKIIANCLYRPDLL